MPGDGNCLFHSLTHGTAHHDHRSLRRAVVRYMTDHWDQYRDFATEPDYLRHMGREGTWGDEPVLRAYHDLTGARVEVYDPRGRLISVYGGSGCRDVRRVRFTGCHYDALPPPPP